MTRRFCPKYCRAWSLASLLVLAALFTACGSQQPMINPDNAVSITRTNGSATHAHAASGNSEGDLTDSALLVPNDQLYTTPDRTVTLQFPDGSTLQMGPNSRLVLLSIRSTGRVAIFRLLSGSVKGDLRGNAFEVQGYKAVAIKFNMALAELAAILRSTAGAYQLEFDGNTLKAVVNSGEFDLRSGNQEATLQSGWQAIAEPDKPLRIVPMPAPPSAADVSTATPIQIISITPTNTPTETPTATYTPTRPPTRIPTNTPTPTPTDKPEPRPKPTKPPPEPTEPPPEPTNPPPDPTERPTIAALG